MTDRTRLMFNPPPGWPSPPPGWIPPKGWTPDPSWPAPPPGWRLWVSKADDKSDERSGDGSEFHSAQPGTRPQSNPEEGDARDVADRLAILEAENAALRARLESDSGELDDVVLLDDEHVLQHVGIYRYHHPLENAVAYKARLAELSVCIAAMITAGVAIEKSSAFTLNGSLAQGRKMTSDLAKLMLRAYNVEADNVIRSLRAGSVATGIKRLDAARKAIAKLGRLMSMHISDKYHALRIQEVELMGDFLMKREEEREALRAERERLREERKVAEELVTERERLQKEKCHIAAAIDKLQASGTSDPELERKLVELDGAIAQNEHRVANIRAGYVYVISNRGAFGDRMVKIGLTRRLEPLERIYELGDASVPFRFDVHALYFSEDAVALEADLHRRFAERRVNWANSRKEFFFATPAEVRDVLTEMAGNLLEFADHADATEYLQSIQYWPAAFRPAGES